MANIETSAVMRFKDKDGGIITVYPKTRAEDVIGLPDAIPMPGVPIVNATSDDGVTYTATRDDITDLTVGQCIVFVPNRVSASAAVKLNLNGLGAKTISVSLSSSSSVGLTPKTDFFTANRPCLLVYNGNKWMTVINRIYGEDIYGLVPVSNGGVPSATTANDGQILSVVEGVPTWIAIESAENASF